MARTTRWCRLDTWRGISSNHHIFGILNMQVDFEMMVQIPARSPSGDCSAELEQFPFINSDFLKKTKNWLFLAKPFLPASLAWIKSLCCVSCLFYNTLSSLLFRWGLGRSPFSRNETGGVGFAASAAGVRGRWISLVLSLSEQFLSRGVPSSHFISRHSKLKLRSEG